jgi:hypothetical protein
LQLTNRTLFSHPSFWSVNDSLVPRMLAVLGVCAVLSGCQTLGLLPYRLESSALTPRLVSHGFVEHLPVGMPVKVWFRPAQPATESAQEARLPSLVVIESDGADWGAGGLLPPTNPTPHRAVGAEIALALSRDYKGEVIYLARHCQFIGREHPAFDVSCRENTLWTNGRFGASVVRDFLHILANLPGKDGAAVGTHWILTGFSGGGTLAALVATELPGVRCLVTFAAPLDIDAWVGVHGLSPLDRSLNPADRVHVLEMVADKAFWYGERDHRVPLRTAGRLLEVEPLGRAVKSMGGFTHRADSGWIAHATELLQRSCPDFAAGLHEGFRKALPG